MMEYERGLRPFCSSFSLFIVVPLLNISVSYLQFKLFNFMHEGRNGYNYIQNSYNIINIKKEEAFHDIYESLFVLLRRFTEVL